MKNLKNYILFNENKNIYSGDFVSSYIIDISNDAGNDVPDFFIDEYIKNNSFSLEKISIDEILKSDDDLKEYFDYGEDRYDFAEDTDEYPHYDNLFNPIVVFNDKVLDGYNRILILSRFNIKEVNAYVNIIK